jgi:uncharacterized protein with PQ loop repeat
MRLTRQKNRFSRKNSPPFRETYMKFIAIVAQLPIVLQILKILTTKSSGDISVPGLILALFCAINWLVYSFKLQDHPLILSSFLTALLLLSNLIVTLLYK